MIRTDDVVELTRALVAIDAVNPALVDGGAGEREIAEAIGLWLVDRGFDVRLVGADPAPQRAGSATGCRRRAHAAAGRPPRHRGRFG